MLMANAAVDRIVMILLHWWSWESQRTYPYDSLEGMWNLVPEMAADTSTYQNLGDMILISLITDGATRPVLVGTIPANENTLL